MNAVLIIVDIIWVIAVSGVWTTVSNNKAWDSLHGLHVFALFLSAVNIIIKVNFTFINIDILSFNSQPFPATPF